MHVCRMLWVHTNVRIGIVPMIHVGMSACFARPFVHQSVPTARLSVRLMIVFHCAHRFIFRPSICLIFRPSVCMSVGMYVHMYLCRDELSGHRKLN